MTTDGADPTAILDLLVAFRKSKAMFAAVSLGVFDALEAGPKAAAPLAAELRAHPDALARLLDACVGLGLLTHAGGGYATTPAASAYLTAAGPRRLTGGTSCPTYDASLGRREASDVGQLDNVG